MEADIPITAEGCLELRSRLLVEAWRLQRVPRSRALLAASVNCESLLVALSHAASAAKQAAEAPSTAPPLTATAPALAQLSDAAARLGALVAEFGITLKPKPAGAAALRETEVTSRVRHLLGALSPSEVEPPPSYHALKEQTKWQKAELKELARIKTKLQQELDDLRQELHGLQARRQGGARLQGAAARQARLLLEENAQLRALLLPREASEDAHAPHTLRRLAAQLSPGPGVGVTAEIHTSSWSPLGGHQPPLGWAGSVEARDTRDTPLPPLVLPELHAPALHAPALPVPHRHAAAEGEGEAEDEAKALWEDEARAQVAREQAIAAGFEQLSGPVKAACLTLTLTLTLTPTPTPTPTLTLPLTLRLYP